MVLFFTSMFPAASLYHLPCQTVSGMWCHVPAVGRARSALRPRRAGRTGTGSCPRTRPPGNAAPHRAEARTQTRPVFRSSPRWPRAPSGMPPSSPEGQPVPPTLPRLWLPPVPTGSARRGSTHRCSRPPRTRKASALRTSALTGQTLDCSFRTESVKNNWEERGRDPLQRQLISKGRGASPGAAGADTGGPGRCSGPRPSPLSRPLSPSVASV